MLTLIPTKYKNTKAIPHGTMTSYVNVKDLVAGDVVLYTTIITEGQMVRGVVASVQKAVAKGYFIVAFKDESAPETRWSIHSANLVQIAKRGF